MINYLKKLYKKKIKLYYAKKFTNLIEKIEILIYKEDYIIAKKELYNLKMIIENKFKGLKNYKVDLLSLYLYFVFNDYKKVLSLLSDTKKEIDNTTYVSEEKKKYLKAFIFNIEMISYIGCGEIDNANNARKKLIKYLDFSIYKTGNLSIEEITDLENYYPIVNSRGRNMSLNIINNEYSEGLDISKKRIIHKYLSELENILNNNKK